MRTYIGPIGFNPTSVTRPILSHGLEDGDAVTLVRPQEETDDRRAEETMADVDRTLGALEPEISTRIERVPHDDFGASVLACQELIYGATGERILVLGGGARDVLIPLTIAGLAAVDSISLVLSYSDIDGAVRETALPNLMATVPDSARETLGAIDPDEGTSLPDIAGRVDHSKSSITRHVNRLSAQGLVEAEMEGRTKRVSITTAGRLLLNRLSDASTEGLDEGG